MRARSNTEFFRALGHKGAALLRPDDGSSKLMADSYDELRRAGGVRPAPFGAGRRREGRESRAIFFVAAKAATYKDIGRPEAMSGFRFLGAHSLGSV